MAAAAKLSPPRLSRQVVARERLHQRIDQLAAQGVVWIAAPAGSGKTTLAADWARSRGKSLLWYEVDDGDGDAASFMHYLRSALAAAAKLRARLPARYSPDARQSLAAVVRTFARQLHACLPAQAVLVLDNTERLPPDSQGQHVLRALVGELRASGALLVISRQAPGNALARECMDDTLAVLAWDEIRLTPQESLQLAQRRWPQLDATDGERLHVLADGWPAGVRLLAEQALLRARAARPGGVDRFEALFAYIAQEVFGALPPDRQALLLGIAALPFVSADIAQAATGRADAAGLLDEFARSEFFTSRLPGPTARFRLHPLLRQFLLAAEARLRTRAQRDTVRRRAAQALAHAGEVEAAAALWIELGDWTALEALLEAAGDTLLQHGRHALVQDWLAAVPAAWTAGRPLLALWRARARAGLEPAAALAEVTALWPVLEREAPLARLVDAWYLVVSCQIGTSGLLDAWEPAARRLLARLEDPAQARLRRSALATTYVGFARSGPPAWDFAEAAAIEMVCDPTTPLDVRLVLGCRMQGGPPLWRVGARRLPEAAAAELRRLCLDGHGSTVPRLCWMWADAVTQLWLAPTQGLTLATQLLEASAELVQAHGVVHFGFPHSVGLHLAVVQGNLPAAGRHAAATLALPEPAPQAAFERCQRHHYLAAYELACGRHAEALAHAGVALPAALASASPMLEIGVRTLRARALAQMGRPSDAFRELRVALANGRRGRVGGPRCGPWLAAAALALGQGREAAAAACAARAMRIAAQQGVLRPVSALFAPQEMAALCAAAWRHPSCRPWVAHLAQALGLAPPPGTGAEGWPWAVRLRVLGPLAIDCAGRDLAFGRKPPRKVLELLGFLLAAGERPLAVSHVVDTLWPDQEGDAGYRAFISALHRLRKLLGEQALVHAENRVGLDPAVVHVDRFEFERLCERRRDEAALRAAQALYRGPLLGHEADSWLTGPREHLRARYKRAVCDLGALLAARGDAGAAREAFEAGLAQEPAAEEFYQGAIRACLTLGLQGEALLLARRAEQALRRAFGVGLSAGTHALLAPAAPVRESVTYR